MDRISELEARIAMLTREENNLEETASNMRVEIFHVRKELERLKSEPDWERYRGMVTVFKRWSDNLMLTDKGIVNALLAARNHDPDVVALVKWARDLIEWDSDLVQASRSEVIAPFAAIPLAAIKGD